MHIIHSSHVDSTDEYGTKSVLSCGSILISGVAASIGKWKESFDVDGHVKATSVDLRTAAGRALQQNFKNRDTINVDPEC